MSFPTSAWVRAALDGLSAALTAAKQDVSEKGVAGGYASLDGGGRVPVAQLPVSIMSYEGTWNAATNTPTLADGVGDAGQVYRVSVAGSQNLGSGVIAFSVGDYAIYNGSVWEQSDTTDAVDSVAGLTGTISASGLKTALSLSNVDNTPDADKPVSTPQQTAINAKVADAINDGTTTIAPSQNAVFDALALKAPLAGTPTLPTFNFASGTYITPHLAATTGGLGSAVLRLLPFFVPQTLTITRIGAEITTIGDVGSKVRLGIYADTGAGMPGALLLDAGQINGDSATVQEITLGSSLVLTRGWYWAGGAAQSVTVTAPTARAVTAGGPYDQGGGFLFALGTSMPAAGVNAVGYSMTGVTGALPATFTSSGTNGITPRLFFKLA